MYKNCYMTILLMQRDVKGLRQRTFDSDAAPDIE